MGGPANLRVSVGKETVWNPFRFKGRLEQGVVVEREDPIGVIKLAGEPAMGGRGLRRGSFIKDAGNGTPDHQLRFVPLGTPCVLPLEAEVVLDVEKSKELFVVERVRRFRPAFAGLEVL